MFVKTDPQRSLLECEFLLPEEKAERLRKSWAEPFRKRILPLIDEEIFRDAYCDDNGRPNRSIRLLVGLHLLKECNDLTDEQVLDQLEYNLQWHYALGLLSEETHLCQKTLHNFRVKLMANERAQRLFEEVTRALAEADGLKLGRQRLDSTHVLSNIAVLTRLGLFVETVTHFLRELRAEAPEAFTRLDGGFARRYLEREGYFSDANREQARRRLPVVARDVYSLVRAFELDATVSSLPSFALLVRLFEEQCEVVDGDDDHGGDDGDDGGQRGLDGRDGLRVVVCAPKTVRSDSLQSPHDPDATYGHKGKGYEVQVAETCDEDNPYQVITATSVNGAHESDQKALLPMLDQLAASEMLPDELLADTGYGSGANIVASARRGVELRAPVQDPEAPPPVEHFAAPVSEQTAALSTSDVVETALLTTDGPVKDEPDEPEILLGMAAFSFTSTFEQVLSCPAAHAPKQQHLVEDQVIAVFSCEHCTGCSQASRCPTRELVSGDRQLRRSPAALATECRQAEQQTGAFKDRYRQRSGVESTNRELKGRHGLDDLRVRGRPRVEVASTLKALSLNVKRAVQYHVAQMMSCAPCAC